MDSSALRIDRGDEFDDTLSAMSDASFMSTTSDMSTTATTMKTSRQKWTRYTWNSNWEYLMVSTATCMNVSEGIRLALKSLDSTEPCLAHFLVVYFVVLIPVCYTQVFIGQYCQMGISFFKHLTPLGHGLAYCFILQSMVSCALESMMLAYNLLYFLSSFRAQLEWMECPPGTNETCWGLNNHMFCPENCLSSRRQISATIFFSDIFMDVDLSADYNHLSSNPSFTQSTMVLAAWILVCYIANRGLASYIKLIRINVYIICVLTLLLLLVCVLTNGATTGLSNMFFVPHDSLFNMHAWGTACYQAMAMMNLGQIYHVTYGSYMTPTMEASSLSTVVVFLNFLFSLTMLALVYSVIGIIITKARMDFDDLKFIWQNTFLPQFSVVPQGLGFLGAPQLWTAIYFVIASFLLLNALVSQVDVIERSISEAHPRIRTYRSYTIAAISIICCCAGIVLLSSKYFEIFKDLIYHVLPAAFCFVMLVFTVLVYWIYGVQRLSDDIHFLCGKQPTEYYKVCWHILPLVCAVPYIHYILSFNNKFIYWVVIIGLAISLPLLLVLNMFRYLKKHNLIGMIQPEERWGPPDPKDRRLRRMFNPREETRIRRRNDACRHKCLWNSKILTKAVNAEETYEEDEGDYFVSSSISFFDED